MQTILIATKIIVSLIFLLYASWSDYKSREVSNKLWIIYAPIALILSLIEYLIFDISYLILLRKLFHPYRSVSPGPTWQPYPDDPSCAQNRDHQNGSSGPGRD